MTVNLAFRKYYENRFLEKTDGSSSSSSSSHTHEKSLIEEGIETATHIGRDVEFIQHLGHAHAHQLNQPITIRGEVCTHHYNYRILGTEDHVNQVIKAIEELKPKSPTLHAFIHQEIERGNTALVAFGENEIFKARNAAWGPSARKITTESGQILLFDSEVLVSIPQCTAESSTYLSGAVGHEFTHEYISQNPIKPLTEICGSPEEIQELTKLWIRARNECVQANGMKIPSYKTAAGQIFNSTDTYYFRWQKTLAEVARLQKSVSAACGAAEISQLQNAIQMSNRAGSIFRSEIACHLMQAKLQFGTEAIVEAAGRPLVSEVNRLLGSDILLESRRDLSLARWKDFAHKNTGRALFGIGLGMEIIHAHRQEQESGKPYYFRNVLTNGCVNFVSGFLLFNLSPQVALTSPASNLEPSRVNEGASSDPTAEIIRGIFPDTQKILDEARNPKPLSPEEKEKRVFEAQLEAGLIGNPWEFQAIPQDYAREASSTWHEATHRVSTFLVEQLNKILPEGDTVAPLGDPQVCRQALGEVLEQMGSTFSEPPENFNQWSQEKQAQWMRDQTDAMRFETEKAIEKVREQRLKEQEQQRLIEQEQHRAGDEMFWGAATSSRLEVEQQRVDWGDQQSVSDRLHTQEQELPPQPLDRKPSVLTISESSTSSSEDSSVEPSTATETVQTLEEASSSTPSNPPSYPLVPVINTELYRPSPRVVLGRSPAGNFRIQNPDGSVAVDIAAGTGAGVAVTVSIDLLNLGSALETLTTIGEFAAGIAPVVAPLTFAAIVGWRIHSDCARYRQEDNADKMADHRRADCSEAHNKYLTVCKPLLNASLGTLSEEGKADLKANQGFFEEKMQLLCGSLKELSESYKRLDGETRAGLINEFVSQFNGLYVKQQTIERRLSLESTFASYRALSIPELFTTLQSSKVLEDEQKQTMALSLFVQKLFPASGPQTDTEQAKHYFQKLAVLYPHSALIQSLAAQIEQSQVSKGLLVELGRQLQSLDNQKGAQLLREALSALFPNQKPLTPGAPPSPTAAPTVTAAALDKKTRKDLDNGKDGINDQIKYINSQRIDQVDCGFIGGVIDKIQNKQKHEWKERLDKGKLTNEAKEALDTSANRATKELWQIIHDREFWDKVHKQQSFEALLGLQVEVKNPLQGNILQRALKSTLGTEMLGHSPALLSHLSTYVQKYPDDSQTRDLMQSLQLRQKALPIVDTLPNNPTTPEMQQALLQLAQVAPESDLASSCAIASAIASESLDQRREEVRAALVDVAEKKEGADFTQASTQLSELYKLCPETAEQLYHQCIDYLLVLGEAAHAEALLGELANYNRTSSEVFIETRRPFVDFHKAQLPFSALSAAVDTQGDEALEGMREVINQQLEIRYVHIHNGLIAALTDEEPREIHELCQDLRAVYVCDPERFYAIYSAFLPDFIRQEHSAGAQELLDACAACSPDSPLLNLYRPFLAYYRKDLSFPELCQHVEYCQSQEVEGLDDLLETQRVVSIRLDIRCQLFENLLYDVLKKEPEAQLETALRTFEDLYAYDPERLGKQLGRWVDNFLMSGRPEEVHQLLASFRSSNEQRPTEGYSVFCRERQPFLDFLDKKVSFGQLSKKFIRFYEEQEQELAREELKAVYLAFFEPFAQHKIQVTSQVLGTLFKTLGRDFIKDPTTLPLMGGYRKEELSPKLRYMQKLTQVLQAVHSFDSKILPGLAVSAFYSHSVQRQGLENILWKHSEFTPEILKELLWKQGDKKHFAALLRLLDSTLDLSGRPQSQLVDYASLVHTAGRAYLAESWLQLAASVLPAALEPIEKGLKLHTGECPDNSTYLFLKSCFSALANLATMAQAHYQSQQTSNEASQESLAEERSNRKSEPLDAALEVFTLAYGARSASQYRTAALLQNASSAIQRGDFKRAQEKLDQLASPEKLRADDRDVYYQLCIALTYNEVLNEKRLDEQLVIWEKILKLSDHWFKGAPESAPKPSTLPGSQVLLYRGLALLGLRSQLGEPVFREKFDSLFALYEVPEEVSYQLFSLLNKQEKQPLAAACNYSKKKASMPTPEPWENVEPLQCSHLVSYALGVVGYSSVQQPVEASATSQPSTSRARSSAQRVLMAEESRLDLMSQINNDLFQSTLAYASGKIKAQDFLDQVKARKARLKRAQEKSAKDIKESFEERFERGWIYFLMEWIGQDLDKIPEEKYYLRLGKAKALGFTPPTQLLSRHFVTRKIPENQSHPIEELNKLYDLSKKPLEKQLLFFFALSKSQSRKLLNQHWYTSRNELCEIARSCFRSVEVDLALREALKADQNTIDCKEVGRLLKEGANPNLLYNTSYRKNALQEPIGNERRHMHLLHRAAELRFSGLIGLLKTYGAHLNVKDYFNMTPLESFLVGACPEGDDSDETRLIARLLSGEGSHPELASSSTFDLYLGFEEANPLIGLLNHTVNTISFHGPCWSLGSLLPDKRKCLMKDPQSFLGYSARKIVDYKRIKVHLCH